MSVKASFNNLAEYLPRRESFQFIMSPPFLFVSYLSRKYNDLKRSSTNEDSFVKTSTTLVQPVFLGVLLEKISQVTSFAHSVFRSNNNHFQTTDSCDTSVVNPKDFWHMFNNCHTNVPKCCVEPYIIYGYPLPYMSWRYYLKVLYTPNNEALNVWSHLLPSFYFMWMLFSFSQDVKIDLFAAWPLLFITLAAIFLTFCSSLAHMFHSRSSFHHCCWFFLDYFGITMLAFSSTTAHFFASAELDYYRKFGWYNLGLLTVICFIGFYYCSISKVHLSSGSTSHRFSKLWTNGCGYFYGMLPVFYRLFTAEVIDPSIPYHKLQFVFFVLTPVWYASDIPQRFWPGKFDFIFHSHQIFHVFVALSCYFDIRATYLDVTSERWIQLSKEVDYPSLLTVCGFAFVLVVYCLFVGVYFSRKVKECHRQEYEAVFTSTCQPALSHSIVNGSEERLKKKE